MYRLLLLARFEAEVRREFGADMAVRSKRAASSGDAG